MAGRILACLACLLSPALAREDCPSGVCPEFADETSFFQHTLVAQGRKHEATKTLKEATREEARAAEGSISESSAFWAPDGQPRAPAWSLLATRVSQNTGMQSGWAFFFVLIFFCCCVPAIGVLVVMPMMLGPPHKDTSEFKNKSAKGVREKFDKECPEDDQMRYSALTPTGEQFKKKCDTMFNEVEKARGGFLRDIEPGEACLRRLQPVVEKAYPALKSNAVIVEAFNVKAGDDEDRIDKEEFFEMMKYMEWKKDCATGVFAKEAAQEKEDDKSSQSGKDSDDNNSNNDNDRKVITTTTTTTTAPEDSSAPGQKKVQTVQTVQTVQQSGHRHHRDDGSDSSDGGGGVVETVATVIVADAIIDDIEGGDDEDDDDED